MRAHSLQSRLTLCDPMGCSPPGSSVHGILQAGMLDWVALMPLLYINITQLRISKTVGHVEVWPWQQLSYACTLCDQLDPGHGLSYWTLKEMKDTLWSDTTNFYGFLSHFVSTELYSSSHAKHTLACSHVSYWGTILQMSRLRFGVRRLHSEKVTKVKIKGSLLTTLNL